MESQKVYAVIADLLVEAGAAICFGLSGTANFKITQALEARGVPCVTARHECNAVTMADIYARMTGNLALASVHSGPGLTHAATAIAEAAKSATPLLVLAGDVATGDLNSNFSMNQAGFVSSLGGVYERIYSARSATADTARALLRVLTKHQTVVLGLPVDIQEENCPESRFAWRAPGLAALLHPEEDQVASVAELLANAERPLFIGGRGAHLSGAGEAIRNLARRCGGILATTACANGLFVDDEWSLGICGGFSSEAALELIPQSDVVVAFGASLNKWTTKSGKIFAGKRALVQVDTDTMKLSRNIGADQEIHADARVAAEMIDRHLSGMSAGKSHPSWRTPETRAIMQRLDGRNHPYDDRSGPDAIDPRTLSRLMDEMLPLDRVLVTDGGHFMGWPPRYIHVADAGSCSLALSFQCVSLGMASAIGAAMACPGRLVVLGAGDGGFLMSIADLETAVRLKCRLCIIVYNDNSYSAEVHHFSHLGFPTSMVEFPDTDIASIARGFGARAATVRTREDLAQVGSWLDMGAPGVFVIDAKVDPSLEADWHRDAYKD